MIEKYKLFTKTTCPNCPVVKAYVQASGINGEEIDASTDEGIKSAQDLGISTVPTVLFMDSDDNIVGTARNINEVQQFIKV